MQIKVKKAYRPSHGMCVMAKLEGERRFNLELPETVDRILLDGGWGELTKKPKTFEFYLKKPQGESIRLTRYEFSEIGYALPSGRAVWFCYHGMCRVFGERRPKYIYIQRSI